MENIQKKQITIDSNIYAKCCFNECKNKAEWVIGTWQCCDECAKKHVTETENGFGYSAWGTSSRAGQKYILEHNIKYNLKHYLT